MSTNSKRATVLPNSLWRGENTTEFIKSQITTPKKALKKNHGAPLAVPVIAKEIQQDILRPKVGSLDMYHRSYNIDQAGPGVIALKDSDNLPTCLIKECEARKLRYIRSLRPISHTNLISLLDFFQSGEKVYLVYEYEHMAISLGCIAGIVEFNEADIATLCKEILKGLDYIHSELKTSYGQLHFSNIVLTWKGEVKIGTFFPSV
jgi:serine/threonine protein kinase